MRMKSARFIFTAVSLMAAPLPNGVRKNASMGGITEYSYSNGLRVLLFPDASNPKITVNMTYLVGRARGGWPDRRG